MPFLVSANISHLSSVSAHTQLTNAMDKKKEAVVNHLLRNPASEVSAGQTIAQ